MIPTKKYTIGLLGSGKTGGEVIPLVKADGHSIKVFNRQNPPTTAALKSCDVIIAFVASDVFLSYLEMLLDCARPVVCGSTGHPLPKELDARLRAQSLTWVWGTNFSLGMRLVQAMIEIMRQAPGLLQEGRFSMKETHHVHKKDAPSGTALSWQKWLGSQCPIESIREGDVVGDHQLVFETSNEKITLRHEAKNRGLFASGALWTALHLCQNNDEEFPKETGLVLFEQFALERLKEKLCLH